MILIWPPTCRTKQRINLINFADHLGQASGREMILPFNDQRMEGRYSRLAYLASVSIRISLFYIESLFFLEYNKKNGDVTKSAKVKI
jgi:hypothetical protein